MFLFIAWKLPPPACPGTPGNFGREATLRWGGAGRLGRHAFTTFHYQPKASRKDTALWRLDLKVYTLDSRAPAEGEGRGSRFAYVSPMLALFLPQVGYPFLGRTLASLNPIFAALCCLCAVPGQPYVGPLWPHVGFILRHRRQILPNYVT